MSLCGNRSPITGECIIGCPGFGGCRRGGETPAPAFVRWEMATDPRTRPLHGMMPPPSDPFWGHIEPPRNLGRFNCRGEYVMDRPRITPAWPQDVTVPPPPMRGRHRDAQVGTELGAPCFRQGGRLVGWCQGTMELQHDPWAGHPNAAGQEVGLECSECLEQWPC